MYAFGQADGNYTSLAGISYPVASVRLHNLGLVNGWTAAPSVLGGRPTAGIQNGIVYLTGAIHQPSGTSTRFATLPRALRLAFGIDAHNYSGLAGIPFPVSS
jgi:hypothetical protein